MFLVAEQDFPIWKSTNPTKDDWKIAVDTLKVGAWDCTFHYDEDKDKLYLYWGSATNGHFLELKLKLKLYNPKVM